MTSTMTPVEKTGVDGIESMEGNDTSGKPDNSSIQELREEIEKLKQLVQNVPLAGELDAVTWDEFINNTTFHGVKYMFTKGIILRRVLWFIVVAIGVTLFVYQVADRIVVFYERNTNVDVAVKYVPSVEFPTVTICNQNSYRITSAVEWKLYNFINDYFATNKAIDKNNYNLTGINTTAFERSTAHQKEDLIHRCTWNGQLCNISQDFKTSVTDLGVCYTFNAERPAVLVHESGSNNALSLLLNVEQYEIMRGPQIDAGVKILLHDQGEVPQMKDQGFAVAPGTHTFVGIKQIKVTNLPDPYGECEDKNPVPVSECQLRCRTKAVVEMCGCHAVYMKSGNEYENNQTSCTCPVPCERVHYEPKLSYAQLSRVNVDTFVATDEQRMEQLRAKFYKASETSQRNVRPIVKRDEAEINGLLDAATAVHLGAEHVYYHVGGSPEVLYEWMGRLSYHWNIFQSDVFTEDEETITEFIDEKTDLLETFENVNVNYTSIYEAQSKFWNLMIFENNGGFSKTVEFFRFCFNQSDDNKANISDVIDPSQTGSSAESVMNEQATTTMIPEVPSTESSHASQDLTMENPSYENNFTWIDINSYDECNEAFEAFKQQFQLSYTLKHIEDSEKLYNVFIAYGIVDLEDEEYHDENDEYYYDFEDNGDEEYYDENDDEYYYDYEDNDDEYEWYKEYEQNCFKRIDEAIDVVTTYEETLEYMININNTDNFGEALENAEEIEYLHQEYFVSKTSFDEMEMNLREACNWTKEVAQEVRQKATSSKANIAKVLESTRRMEAPLRLWSEHLYAIGREGAFPIEGMMNQYMDNYVTKAELGEQFNSPIFSQLRKDFSNNVTDMKEMMKQYVSELYVVRDLLWHGYIPLQDTSPAIIDYKNLQELQLVQSAKTVHSQSYDMYGWAERGELDHIIFNIPEVIKDVVIKDITHKVEEPLGEMVNKLEMVETNLEYYQESIEMDSDFFLDNFLQVDIFYQELSYEEIEQNIAFEFLSLLSEIGGFLGLLLGASVLTVCELVDFVTLAAVNKFKKKQNAVGVLKG